jgi:hypothetical protein
MRRLSYLIRRLCYIMRKMCFRLRKQSYLMSSVGAQSYVGNMVVCYTAMGSVYPCLSM